MNFLLEKKFEPIDFEIIPFDCLEIVAGGCGGGGGSVTITQTTTSGDANISAGGLVKRVGLSGGGQGSTTTTTTSVTSTGNGGGVTSITFNESGGIQNIQMAP